jgi:uncharacterized protein YacL
MFVIPSVIFGYIASIPALAYIFKFLFKHESDVNIPPIPTLQATIKGLIVGLIIPMLSSIIPI